MNCYKKTNLLKLVQNMSGKCSKPSKMKFGRPLVRIPLSFWFFQAAINVSLIDIATTAPKPKPTCWYKIGYSQCEFHMWYKQLLNEKSLMSTAISTWDTQEPVCHLASLAIMANLARYRYNAVPFVKLGTLTWLNYRRLLWYGWQWLKVVPCPFSQLIPMLHNDSWLCYPDSGCL